MGNVFEKPESKKCPAPTEQSSDCPDKAEKAKLEDASTPAKPFAKGRFNFSSKGPMKKFCDMPNCTFCRAEKRDPFAEDDDTLEAASGHNVAKDTTVRVLLKDDKTDEHTA